MRNRSNKYNVHNIVNLYPYVSRNRSAEDHKFVVNTERLKDITNSGDNKITDQEEDVEIAQVGIIDGTVVKKEKFILDFDMKRNEKECIKLRHSKMLINPKEGEWRSKKEKLRDKGHVLQTIMEETNIYNE